jgi:hypothetical protein
MAESELLVTDALTVGAGFEAVTLAVAALLVGARSSVADPAVAV